MVAETIGFQFSEAHPSLSCVKTVVRNAVVSDNWQFVGFWAEEKTILQQATRDERALLNLLVSGFTMARARKAVEEKSSHTKTAD
jgi:hypothetical protein